MPGAKTNGGEPTEDAREQKMVDKLKVHFDTAATEINVDFMSLFNQLGTKVAENLSEIQGINKAIERIERRLDGKSDLVLQSRSSPAPSSMGTSRNVEERKENYATSRRSLRIWPIEGSSESEIVANTIRFVFEVLKVSEEDFNGESICQARRVRTARNSSIRSEVLVIFDEKYTRDRVASHGKNLKDYKDNENKPTAGLRLDYPAFLGPVFRDLEWFGAFLREKHGLGTQRSIKFDEANTSLYMDVRVPSQDGWMRVSPHMARLEKEENQAEADKRTRRRLKPPLRKELPRSGCVPAQTRTPAEHPLIGDHTGKTDNFMKDLEELNNGYSGLPTNSTRDRDREQEPMST